MAREVTLLAQSSHYENYFIPTRDSQPCAWRSPDGSALHAQAEYVLDNYWDDLIDRLFSALHPNVVESSVLKQVEDLFYVIVELVDRPHSILLQTYCRNRRINWPLTVAVVGSMAA